MLWGSLLLVKSPTTTNAFLMQEFSTIWHSWLTLFGFMMTGFEFGIFYDCSNPEAATILMVLYMFVVAVIFLNLLIGIMADSWKTVSFQELQD